MRPLMTRYKEKRGRLIVIRGSDEVEYAKRERDKASI